MTAPPTPWQTLAHSPLPTGPGKALTNEELQVAFRVACSRPDLELLERLGSQARRRLGAQWLTQPLLMAWLADAAAAGWAEGVEALLRWGVRPVGSFALKWDALLPGDRIGILDRLLAHGYAPEWDRQPLSDAQLRGLEFAPRVLGRLLEQVPDLPMPSHLTYAWLCVCLKPGPSYHALGEKVAAQVSLYETEANIGRYQRVTTTLVDAQRFWRELTERDAPEVMAQAMRWGWSPPATPGVDSSGETCRSWLWLVAQHRQWRTLDWMLQVPALRDEMVAAARTSPETTLWKALALTTPTERSRLLAVCPDWDRTHRDSQDRTVARKLFYDPPFIANRNWRREIDWWLEHAPESLTAGPKPAVEVLPPTWRAYAQEALVSRFLPAADATPPARRPRM